MTSLPDSVRDFLASGPLAHVVTLGPDGTPHVSLAWAGFDGDEVVFATFFPDQRKIHNLRSDPRVSLSFQATEYEGEGLYPYVVIRGLASLSDGGALAVMDRLAETYIGPGATYPMREFPDGAVIHVAVETIYGTGPWREDQTQT